MGWTNSHLYEIHASMSMGNVGTKTLKYLYRFGDGWEQTIKIQRLTDPDPAASTAPDRRQRSLPSRRRGGPWGSPNCSKQSLTQVRTPRLTEWLADDLKPDIVDADMLTEDVAALAKRWSPEGYGKSAVSDIV
jgi:hypothetical protein